MDITATRTATGIVVRHPDDTEVPFNGKTALSAAAVVVGTYNADVQGTQGGQPVAGKRHTSLHRTVAAAQREARSTFRITLQHDVKVVPVTE